METWGNDKVGCYADSVRGVYQGEKIIELALGLGWDGGTFKQEDFKLTPEGIGYDSPYWDATREAIDYLNENISDEDHIFDNNEMGDFGYWPI